MSADDEERARDLSRQRSETQRSARARALEEERVERAQDLAIKAALEAERVRARLSQHDDHLAAINGSVERTARQLERLNQSIETVKDQCDGLRIDQDKRDAVAEALRVAVQKANEKQISNRTFMLGVAAIIVSIVLAIVAQGHLFG